MLFYLFKDGDVPVVKFILILYISTGTIAAMVFIKNNCVLSGLRNLIKFFIVDVLRKSTPCTLIEFIKDFFFENYNQKWTNKINFSKNLS